MYTFFYYIFNNNSNAHIKNLKFAKWTLWNSQNNLEKLLEIQEQR
jgi:hypothetical protein